MHTIEEALERFTLGRGAGSEADRKACAMTLTSWIAGEEWSDHPKCVHRWLSNIVIRANDAGTTSDDERVELARAAVEHTLDTWWVPGAVVALAVGVTPRDVDEFGFAMSVLPLVSRWKSEGHPVINLVGANLVGANLWGANLVGAYGTPASGIPTGWELDASGLFVKAQP